MLPCFPRESRTFEGSLMAQALIGLGNAKAEGVQIPHYACVLQIAKELRDKALEAQIHLKLGRCNPELKQCLIIIGRPFLEII